LADQLAHCEDALCHDVGRVYDKSGKLIALHVIANDGTSNKEPGEMKTETFLRKLSVVLTAAILVIGVSACASHKATAGDDYGQVRTEASSTQSTSSDQVVGTAAAPANAQNVENTGKTPDIISGPAKVDNSGRAYTSSSVGAAGNSSSTGLNTNVNIIPEKTASSNVTVTQSPAVSTSSTETTTTTTTTIAAPETPAPTVATNTTVETPAPAPTVETPAPTTTETQSTTTESAPMTSSTTQESTTTTTTHTHRRMRKD
jgi:hypothetical protein